MIKILSPDFQFADERGLIVQLVHAGFRQINFIDSKASAVRGGHYHKLNDEAFYIIEGEIELIVQENGDEQRYAFGKRRHVFDPGVCHS